MIVSSVFSADGQWDFNEIYLQIPTEVRNVIKSSPRSILEHEEDRIIWHYSMNGMFLKKSAYALACGRRPQGENNSWGWILRSQTYPRIQMFIWLSCHGKAPTSSRLHHRGLDVPAECPLCPLLQGDIDHTPRKCPQTVAMWNKLEGPSSKRASISLSIKEWLQVNCEAYEKHSSGVH